MAAEWYYAANGQQTGPVELEALRQMLDTASISRADLVYGPGLTKWTPAGQVPALAAEVGVTDEPGVIDLAAPIAAPYAAPAASTSMLGYRGVETDTTGLSLVAMNALRQTKPWVRFISIMTFIGAGIMVLGGLMGFVAGAAMSNSRNGSLPAGLGVVYLAMGALYIIPGVLLSRYASGIARLMEKQRMGDLEQALGAQKSFWKFTGIMIIVVMCVYVVVFVGLISMR